jgi:2-alkyl-3-oxoalkanoate reductase
MKVLVSGASGFLGRHVVAALRRRGHAVRTLIRPSTSHGTGCDEGVDVRRADLLDPIPDDMFDGVDVLVHLAARLRGTVQQIRDTAVRGTENLLGVMARSTCRRLVLASSLSVYDWTASGGELTEDWPLAPDPSERYPYASAKLAQEDIARRLSTGHRWNLTILRPGFIWGPGNAYPPCLGPTLGPFLAIVAPTARPPLTYVENCATAFALAAEARDVREAILNVVDDSSVRSWDFAGQFLDRSGQRGLRIPLPYTPTRLGTSAMRTVAGLLGRDTLPDLLIPGRFEARFRPVTVSAERARQVLGWIPPLDHEACLDRTFGSPEGSRCGPEIP